MAALNSPKDECMALVDASLEAADQLLLWVDESGRVLETNARAANAFPDSSDAPADRYLWQLFFGLTAEDWQACAAVVGTEETSPDWHLAADSQEEVKLRRYSCGGRVYFRVVVGSTCSEVVARQLLREVWGSQELHSRQLALRIHDRLIQPLAAALMSLDAYLPEIAADSRDHAERALAILRDVLNHSRRLMTDIWSPELDEEDFAGALQHLVFHYSKHHDVDLEFAYDVPMPSVPAPLRSALYRIAQESLTNLVQHSATQRGRVELSAEDDAIRLAVEDSGIGFDLRELTGDCPGLNAIRARSELFGGTSEIISAPGKGTRIAISIPLQNPLGQLLS